VAVVVAAAVAAVAAAATRTWKRLATMMMLVTRMLDLHLADLPPMAQLLLLDRHLQDPRLLVHRREDLLWDTPTLAATTATTTTATATTTIAVLPRTVDNQLNSHTPNILMGTATITAAVMVVVVVVVVVVAVAAAVLQ